MPTNTAAQSQEMAAKLMRMLDEARSQTPTPRHTPRTRTQPIQIPTSAILMSDMNIIEAASKKVKLLKVKEIVSRMEAPTVRGRQLSETEGYTTVAAESLVANFKEGKFRTFKEFKKNILNHINDELSNLSRVLSAA